MNGVGASNGTGRRAFDRWFRYPAGFSGPTIASAFAALDLKPGDRVVDCFAGVATTGTEAIRAGISFTGIEGHPLIADLAALKLRRPNVTGDELRTAGAALLKKLDSPSSGRKSRRATDRSDLVKRCFTPEALQDLEAIRDHLRRSRKAEVPYLRWAMLGALRETASVKTGWPYQRPNIPRRDRVPAVRERFEARVELIAADIEQWQSDWASGSIVVGDSRTADAWKSVADRSIDGCVASPPYLNNYDYVDATRLELYFMGSASSWSELLHLARSNLVTATTHHSTDASAVPARQRLTQHRAVASSIEVLAKRLIAERAKRPRSKEYDRLLSCYFSDIADVLRNLHRAIRVGGRIVWIIGDSAPYGVYVDTPQLVAALAEDIGFRLIEDKKVRDRGLRWQTNGTRHEVALSERMVTLERLSKRGQR